MIKILKQDCAHRKILEIEIISKIVVVVKIKNNKDEILSECRLTNDEFKALINEVYKEGFLGAL